MIKVEDDKVLFAGIGKDLVSEWMALTVALHHSLVKHGHDVGEINLMLTQGFTYSLQLAEKEEQKK